MHSNENDTQRALRLARERILANGLCRGPLLADGRSVCLAGALGFTRNCSDAIDTTTQCGGLRLNPTGVVAGGHEAVHIAAAETLTRLAAIEPDPEPYDYFAGDFDEFDVEVLGDLCWEADAAQHVIDVLDAASSRAETPVG